MKHMSVEDAAATLTEMGVPSADALALAAELVLEEPMLERLSGNPPLAELFKNIHSNSWFQ